MGWKWIRTYIVTPPFSALCFTGFWSMGIVASWFDRGTGRLVHLVARLWSWLLLNTAGIRIVTGGLENIDPKGVYVLVANHLSLADTPLMCAYLPLQFRFLAKESLMRTPIIGGHLRRGAHIPVARDDAKDALRSLVRASKLMNERHVSIMIFAEGTRGTGEELQSFRGGAALLAIKAQVPIIPLAVSGTEQVMPKGVKLLRPGTIRLLAGPPISTAGLHGHDRDKLTERLREAVNDLRKKTVDAA